MLFEKLVSENFALKVRDLCGRLGIHPDHLMALMWSESGLNPRARNPRGGATGLIQFMPATARGLGTSCEALLHMDAERQLAYVERFFRPYASRCRNFPDLYLCCFFPAALGKGEEFVLRTASLSASLIASQNPAIDLDRNGEITVGEFRRWLQKRFPDEMHPFLF